MDETGLFFKMALNRTLRDHAANGQKKCKDRITVGLYANIDGSFKCPPLIINKHLNPRPFSRRKIKRPNNLGIWWYANPKTWMTALVFQNWLLKFDKLLKALGRKKVALLLDNAPGHLAAPVLSKLEVTKLFFLPPNTTAWFQPMDQGIIASFKC